MCGECECEGMCYVCGEYVRVWCGECGDKCVVCG